MKGEVKPLQALSMERGAYVVPLSKTSVSVKVGVVKTSLAKEME
jgi:hypothetical protein